MVLNKRRALLIVVLIVTLFAVGCQDSSNTEDVFVAKVNDQEISKGVFDKHLALYKNDYEGMYGENIWSLDYDGKTFLQAVQEQLLDKLVNDAVIANYLVQNNGELDESEVDKRYTQYMEALEEQKEVKELFEESGIDEEFIKNQLRTDMYIEKFYNMAMEEIDLSDEALKKYYEDHLEEYQNNLAKASHILVEEEEFAKEILEKIKDGENFEELAKEHSTDPGSAAEGGFLGTFSAGMMVPEFEQVAFQLEPGEISDPVKTQYGYHIIKAFEVTFADVKEDTKGLLINERYARKLQEIKENMVIEKFEENIK